MLARAAQPGSNEAGTYIGAEAFIKGDVNVPHSMRLDGRIQGQINVSDTLMVGQGGQIDGNIQSRSVVIAGRVIGTVTATDKITMDSTAVMTGDLTCSKLVIQEGAVFDGQTRMSGDKLPLMTQQRSEPPKGSPAAVQPNPSNSPGGGKSGDDDTPRWADRGRR